MTVSGGDKSTIHINLALVSNRCNNATLTRFQSAACENRHCVAKGKYGNLTATWRFRVPYFTKVRWQRFE
jgi:hypothetical protein